MDYTQVTRNLQGSWAEHFHLLEVCPKHDVRLRKFSVGIELLNIKSTSLIFSLLACHLTEEID